MSWRCGRILVGAVVLLGGVGCTDDDGSAESEGPGNRVTAATTERLFRLAVEAAEAEDADRLCGLGVRPTCEMTLARLEHAGLAWPSTPPRIVFEGRVR